MTAFSEVAPDIFLWPSTCNTYVLRDGEHALLIDLGDGSVIDQLPKLGIKSVEWVLFTHHHREQCQGATRLGELKAKVAAPAAEKAFFETPTAFRKMRPTLGDPHSVYGASYVRPPVEPIAVDHTFKKMDEFVWRGREFWCIETAGNSPGHMTYALKRDGLWLLFSGDVMVDGARMHNWFDTETDYGFAAGLYALGNSAGQLRGYEPATMLPSHGPIIKNAAEQLDEYIRKLRHFGDLYIRGYDFNRFAGCDQDMVSRPSAVPHVWQVTPHLFKFRGPNYWPNFAIVIADNGHGLVVDCGLFERAFLDQAIERMKERLGLKQIDVLFVTHMHGDHVLEGEHFRDDFGAKLWTMDGIADTFERPYDYDMAAMLPSYSTKYGPLKFDRVLKDGETFTWEGFTFTVDWMPGQTKYHCCLHGMIDRKRVAFTGDNIFASPTDPKQGGNECVLARNGGTLEEGYIFAANYLHDLGPDLLIGGHCWAIDKPAELIERFRDRMEALREAYRGLSTDEDYRYMFDPYQVHVHPYRTALKPGESANVTLKVKNFRQKPQRHRIALRLPNGVSAEPATFEGTVEGGRTGEYPLKLTCGKEHRGVQMIAMDVTLDGRRQGETFDFVVQLGDAVEIKPPAGGASKDKPY